MNRVAFVLLATAFPIGALAQNAPQPATKCAEGVASPYLRCALWLDGRRVRRGDEGAIVGEASGFFQRLPLPRLVQGDSAQWYARRYSTQVRRARAFGITGIVLTVANTIYFSSWDCNRNPPIGYCENGDDKALTITAGLLLGSFAGYLGEAISLAHATRSASRAVWWHNANFAR